MWDATIPGRPPTGGKRKTARTLKHPWTQNLMQQAQGAAKQTRGQVKADIWLFLANTQAQPTGDLDNYAHVILNALKHKDADCLLRDDGDVRDLWIRRRTVLSQDHEGVRIRLRWSG